MSMETKSRQITDTPRDKPVTERTEHANHERPGAQAHPKANAWNMRGQITAWRLR